MNGSKAMQAWQALSEGRYQEALLNYDEVLSHGESLGERMNRGTTRLLIGDHQGALSDFQTARELQQHSAVKVANPQVGVAFWLDGQRQLACEDWADEIRRRQTGDITHSDGAGGVVVPALLWWASCHEGLSEWQERAVQELRNRWRTKQCQRSRWPGSIAAFLLGHLSEEDFITAASSKYAAVQAQYLCQCYFYAGATHLAKAQLNDYRSYLRLSLSSFVASTILDPEYHLARAELNEQ
jgi:lipoprotein NlpI